jgi:molybdate transport system substrate-binding protein
MKNWLSTEIITGLILLAFSQCRPDTGKTDITVFCAAGLTGVITELSDSFSVNRPVNVKMNIGSSGMLARQLKQGNYADIYISANRQWADFAYDLQLFNAREELCHNSLVFICPLSSKFDSILFQDKTTPDLKGRFSMGDPVHVPAGQYAKEALTCMGWWDALEKFVLPAKDTRSALMPVELGECELGIAYYSDALASTKVKICGIVPDSCHSPIVFYALINRRASPQAKEFYQMMINDNFEEIWIKHGLTPVTKVN